MRAGPNSGPIVVVWIVLGGEGVVVVAEAGGEFEVAAEAFDEAAELSDGAGVSQGLGDGALSDAELVGELLLGHAELLTDLIDAVGEVLGVDILHSAGHSRSPFGVRQALLGA